VAYHEAGHALAAALLPEAEVAVQKVTIIPRGVAGGVTWITPEDEQNALNMTKRRMQANIVFLLAGRASEEIVFSDITAGAANDLDRASQMARAMVRQYGMSDVIGPVSFGERSEMVFLGRELAEGKNYSEKVAEVIDGEVSKIVKASYERSRQILIDNRERLDAIAKRLLEKETIDATEFKAIMGMASAPPEPEISPNGSKPA
jgi:cell division protease FtsH